jgi:hypothetical protein
MLTDRTFDPTSTHLLYHYCSPETFLAICSNKTIRFSDIYSMNDFMEMHWGYHRWELAARKAIDSLGREFIESVDSIVSSSALGVLPLAACFSLNGDVLSQWRAYANNGNGFCIGFKADLLCGLAARPLRVLYEPGEQEREIELFLSALHEVNNENQENSKDFFNACVALSCDLAALKNPSFVEEQEVRLIHAVNFVESNQFLRLQDAGGTAFGKIVGPQAINFVMRGSVPVPHVDLSYVDPDGSHAISEVILGPKVDALPTAISVFLETCGLGNVVVKRSHASYR